MRGLTLMEFMASVSLFLVLLFFGYHAFDSQRRLLNNVNEQIVPEKESNYRLLLIKHFLERSSLRLRVDPLLEGAPIFFPDLKFGTNPQKNAFSIAHVTGIPYSFLRSGAHYRVASGAVLEEDKTFLMAGSDIDGNFSTNYVQADQVWTTTEGLNVRFDSLTTNPEIVKGKLIEVEIHGFLYQNQTLYRISPGGALQPYLSSLDAFQYTIQNQFLTVRWQSGAIQMEFRCEI